MRAGPVALETTADEIADLVRHFILANNTAVISTMPDAGNLRRSASILARLIPREETAPVQTDGEGSHCRWWEKVCTLRFRPLTLNF
jgi:hypothetical protein